MLVKVLHNVAPMSCYKDENAVKRLNQQLGRAERIMRDLTQLIRDRLVKDPECLDDDTKPVKLKTVTWFIEERRRKTLSSHLSEVRQSLSATLNAFSA